MLAFQETMRAFLETQQEVMAAYLGASTAGSWPEAEADVTTISDFFTRSDEIVMTTTDSTSRTGQPHLDPFDGQRPRARSSAPGWGKCGG